MKGRDGEPPRDGDDEDIGFGKPPKRTRFQPGQSGNPKGRPKRAFGTHHLPAVILQRAREIFIEEGDRPMTIREGDTLINLDAYRLAVRAAHISAAKGSAMAQRTVIQGRLSVEHEIAAVMNAAFHEAAMYKEACDLKRRQCRKAGLPEPGFHIDPDDVVLDWATLTFEIRGPITCEGRAALEKVLKLRDEWEEDFQFCRSQYEAKGRSEVHLLLALQSQRHFDFINERLPYSHRKELKNRLDDDPKRRPKKRSRKQT